MRTTTLQQDHPPPYWQPVGVVLTTLGTNARHGLSDGEAQARLDTYGKNELTAEQPIPWWREAPGAVSRRARYPAADRHRHFGRPVAV
jgi:Ca2+-transporting ATPase